MGVPPHAGCLLKRVGGQRQQLSTVRCGGPSAPSLARDLEMRKLIASKSHAKIAYWQMTMRTDDEGKVKQQRRPRGLRESSAAVAIRKCASKEGRNSRNKDETSAGPNGTKQETKTHEIRNLSHTKRTRKCRNGKRNQSQTKRSH